MEMDENPRSSKGADRKTIEKNRRNQMKALCSELSILVPNQAAGPSPSPSPSPRETVSLADQLEGATKYIKMQQAKLEEMKQKKKKMWLKDSGMPATATATASSARTGGGGGGLNLPNIDIRVMGSALEMVLITGLDCQFMFNEIIRMLHEDGAEVVNASFSVVDNTIFHTIHSKINGESAARICDRLRKFVHDF